MHFAEWLPKLVLICFYLPETKERCKAFSVHGSTQTLFLISRQELNYFASRCNIISFNKTSGKPSLLYCLVEEHIFLWTSWCLPYTNSFLALMLASKSYLFVKNTFPTLINISSPTHVYNDYKCIFLKKRITLKFRTLNLMTHNHHKLMPQVINM